jgi:hypothetical protein
MRDIGIEYPFNSLVYYNFDFSVEFQDPIPMADLMY